MARNDPMMRFRAPEELKARIEQAAAKNSRTLNAEIIYRLDRSFAESDPPWIAHTRKDALEFQLVQAESKLKWLSEKWNDRLATGKPIGNLESIMYESDISSIEDSILFLKGKIKEIEDL
ncbi:Arc family DNA-binding protein [Komagataeibacter intermedius]|uniref:Arc family DNA-binding protein n=1 Tax=Komagataeibacter intermedius TaxID=66229 RepID=UPI003B43D518